jgi:alkanesulfonate monooxygenase SsuD/methylene tetrahydromethanopterin reductase-like flavin-dependent oxidoreductase (luciferase family)
MRATKFIPRLALTGSASGTGILPSPRASDCAGGQDQLPRPWGPGAELHLFQDALDQVELADRLGIDYAWEVEHHFLEEYSHSSAPEVFLAAASQRSRRIRLGHGIVLMPPGYNPPARVAERVATLDLVSSPDFS